MSKDDMNVIAVIIILAIVTVGIKMWKDHNFTTTTSV